MAIYTGNTVDEAIENGLKDLGIPKEKAHVHIKQTPSNGFLGIFGKKDAKVEITPIATDVKMKADRQAVRDVPEEIRAQAEPVKSASEATVELSQVVAAVKKAEAQKKAGQEDENFSKSVTTDEEVVTEKAEVQEVTEEAPETSVEPEETPVNEEEKAQEVIEQAQTTKNVEFLENLDETQAIAELAKYLTKIAKEIGAPALVKVTREENLIVFNLESKKQGILIGKHGKILNALQYLAQVFIHRVAKDKLSVVVMSATTAKNARKYW